MTVFALAALLFRGIGGHGGGSEIRFRCDIRSISRQADGAHRDEHRDHPSLVLGLNRKNVEGTMMIVQQDDTGIYSHL